MSQGWRTRGQLFALLAFTLALHLPFINQAFHMDDVQYIDLARNAQNQPLFPHDRPYVFDGRVFPHMAGHSHPPLNAYCLALVWKFAGRLSEPAAHGFYLLFPLLATWAFFSLARRMTSHPGLATLLFASVPPLAVMSHTVMADVPTLALSVAGFACFVAGVEENRPGQHLLAAFFLSLAALCSYIALAALAPLFLLAWLKRRLDGTILLALAAPILLLALWQYVNYLHFGQWPIQLLRGYVEQLGYFQLEMRARAATSVFIYLGATVLFPLLLVALLYFEAPRAAAATWVAAIAAIGSSPFLQGYTLPQRVIVAMCCGLGLAVVAATGARLRSCYRLAAADNTAREEVFLLLWFLLTLAAILVLYSVGSNRYILPLAPPLLLWASRRLPQRLSETATRGLLLVAVLWNLGWSSVLARADYQFAEAYRSYARSLAERGIGSDVPLFFSGEWGFRHYLGEIGGEILNVESEPMAGAWVVKSQLCLSRAFDEHLDGPLVAIERQPISLPSRWRLLDRDSHAGFYSTGWGLLPWAASRQPLDVVTLYNWSPFFFALGTARLENATAEQVFPTQLNHDGQRQLIFLQPPESTVNYTMSLPASGRLRFRLFAEPPTGGAVSLRYRVVVREGGNTTVIFLRELNPENFHARLWQPLTVSLRAWAGRTVELGFSIEGKGARAGWAGLTLTRD